MGRVSPKEIKKRQGFSALKFFFSQKKYTEFTVTEIQFRKRLFKAFYINSLIFQTMLKIGLKRKQKFLTDRC